MVESKFIAVRRPTPHDCLYPNQWEILEIAAFKQQIGDTVFNTLTEEFHTAQEAQAECDRRNKEGR